MKQFKPALCIIILGSLGILFVISKATHPRAKEKFIINAVSVTEIKRVDIPN